MFLLLFFFPMNMQWKIKFQNKMQITYYFLASENIDFDHVCHAIMYR